VLDIGCGNKQYANIIEAYASQHIGLDHENTLHDLNKADIVGTAYDIPADDDSFNSILCTEVLEHLEEPEKALQECYRVLKPGGYAVFTCPFIWHLHEEPRDFYRYTKYGLDYLFIKTGFHVVSIEPLNGFWGTFLQLLSYVMNSYNKGPLKFVPVIPAICLVVQGVGYLFDAVLPGKKWPSHYISVIQKKNN